MANKKYGKIRDGLLRNVKAAKLDSKNNLQNLNLLLEGFFREFLNLLYGWSLINANRERPNFPGADLLDRERGIAVQVSGKVDHDKVQDSLDKFKEPGKWEFYYLPIREEEYKPRKPFTPGDNVVGQPHILDQKTLLREVQDADSSVKQAILDFLKPKKVLLWKWCNNTLRETRKNHPSFRLMERDEIDKRLLPGVPGVRWDPMATAEGDQAPCPLWEKVRETWKAKENHSVVIEGKGGIGKTVSLLSLTDKEGRWCPAPAVYIPMHRLIDTEGKLVDLSDYLKKLSVKYGKRFVELAERPWEGGPQVILLLDGFNEVPTEKRRQVLDMVKQWRSTRSGAQLIAVSRPMDGLDLRKELAGDPLFFSLKPLSWETVGNYLEKWKLSLPDQWEELQYPLFLTLYVKTSGLEGQTVAGYPLAPKPPRNGAALIWNYLQRELLKYQDAESNLAEDWVLRCSMACEYILPYVAYEMEKKSRFTIGLKEVLSLTEKAVNAFSPESVLPKHLQDIFAQYFYKHLKKPNLSPVDWMQTVLREVGILIPVQKGTYQFMHQNFRDVLAALHLVNQGEMMQKTALPELWKQGHSSRVLDRAAQLMDPETAQVLWEANRQLDPTQSAATYTQLELQKRVHRGEGFQLDFSGMDLGEISLYHYLTDEEKDLSLLQRNEDTSNTKLSPKTFRAQGHTGSVSCVAVTPSGLCVSGSYDATLRVWDLHTGECLQVLEGHTLSVECVAVTPGGLCVSGASDDTLRVWDLNTGECLRVLVGHTNTVICVTVTSEGLCISGSWDHTLRVWDLNTGECLKVLEGHTNRVDCVAVTPKGLCVSGSQDHTLRVWDLNTGECVRVLEGHTSWVECVAVTPVGLCVSGSRDNTLRVWDLNTGECVRVLKGHTDFVNSVAVTHDGLCISGSGDQTLRIWDPYTGECRRELKGHTGFVNCVAVTPQGLCVSGSDDHTLRVWDLSTEEDSRMLEGHIHTVTCVAAISNNLCVSGSNDYTLRVWDLSAKKCLQELKGHTSWVRCLVVTSDNLCVSGACDHTLRVWDLQAGKFIRELKGHESTVECVAVTRQGNGISGSIDNALRVWDLSTGECLRVLKGHTDRVYCVAMTHQGFCVSGSTDHTLRVWDLSTGECLRVLTGHTSTVYCVAVISDSLCISGSFDHTLRVWDLSTWECLRVLKGHTDWVRGVAVISDSLCISGSADHTLRVWNFHTGECLRVLKGHMDRVNCVAVTPDGRCISGSDDQTLRLWDPNTGECLEVIDPFALDLTSLDVSQALMDPETADYLRRNGATVPED